MNLLNSPPLKYISVKSQKRILRILGITTFVLFLTLGIIDQPLKTTAAPNGIVTFELAGSFNQSQAIISSWNQQAKLSAALSLGIDYLFLVTYSLFFAFLIFKLSKKFVGYNDWLVHAGNILGWLQFVVAIFDAFENYFLIHLLFGS